MTTPLSGCLITCNEADRIDAALRSRAFRDENLAPDSGSPDDTVAHAGALGARVEIQPYAGFRKQKGRAVQLCQHDWVLCRDADIVVDA